MPSEDMMSKREIAEINFIVSSKNVKPPKGQTAVSIFNQIRKNAAQHLMEDMSPLHSYDQSPLISYMKKPKKGKGFFIFNLYIYIFRTNIKRNR
jgi:hypothetical protein